MKLKCVVNPIALPFDPSNDNASDEEIEANQDKANEFDEQLERVTDDKYYCGQDDGKFFYAVAPEFENLLRKIFLKDDILDIDSADYPWDHIP